MGFRSLIPCTLFLVTSWGCAERDAGWAGTVSDSAGVTIVSNPTEGIWDETDRWRLEEELRIGAVEGDAAYQFGLIQGIAVGQDSRIYVLDRLGKQVKVFSPDGVFERTIGGPGGGPGELGMAPLFLALLPGDTLIVFDAPRRINRYAPDGTPFESIPNDMRAGYPLAWRATTTGSVAFQVRPFGQGLGDADTLDAIVQFGGDRLFGDTLLQIHRGETTGEGFDVYPREPVWTLTDDLDVVFGENHEYRLGVYSEGSLNRIISKAHDRRPVSDQEKEVIIKAIQRAVLAGGGDPAAVAGGHGERVRFADFVPPVSGVYIGPAGSLWVSGVVPFLTLTEQEQVEYTYWADVPALDWDVFNREGRFLGQVAMPPGFLPHVFKGDEIYGVQRGEFNVQYVVRLQVIRPGAS